MCRECDFDAMLREAGLRATPRRRLVMDILGAAERPMSAREILSAAAARRPPAMPDRVTVYRVLEALAGRGLLTRLNLGRQARYHLAGTPRHPDHPHFRCLGCGLTACLPPESLKVDVAALSRHLAGAVSGLEVNVEGLCPDCLGSRRPRPGGARTGA